MECPKCGYRFGEENCQCKNLTIFDIDPSLLHPGRERCLKCGKLINEEKSEWILSKPFRKE